MLRFPENVPIWLLLSNHILSVWLLSNQNPTVLITWINHLPIELIHVNITFDISSFSSWIKCLCLCLACTQQFRAAHILQLPHKHFSPPNRTQKFFWQGGWNYLFHHRFTLTIRCPTLPYILSPWILRRQRDNAGGAHAWQLWHVEHSSCSEMDSVTRISWEWFSSFLADSVRFELPSNKVALVYVSQNWLLQPKNPSW